MAGRGINYIKPEEPSFLKQFKAKAGYKEGPTVDTKRKELIVDKEEDRSDNEEEKPQVVVLRDGDLSEDEALRLSKQIKDAPPLPGTKIEFKKPVKRSRVDATDLSVSTKKKKDSDLCTDKKKSSSKKVKNTSLLSFGDDEEEGDSG